MGNRRNPTHPSAVRAALDARTALVTWHDIAVADTETVAAAQEALQQALQLQVATMLHEDPDVRARAAALVEERQAARDECFYRLRFRGLDDDEFDALAQLHPPTTQDSKAGKAWHDETFMPALLAVCTMDSDVTEDEWAARLPGMGADGRKVKLAAIAAQRQTMADAIPKG